MEGVRIVDKDAFVEDEGQSSMCVYLNRSIGNHTYLRRQTLVETHLEAITEIFRYTLEELMDTSPLGGAVEAHLHIDCRIADLT